MFNIKVSSCFNIAVIYVFLKLKYNVEIIVYFITCTELVIKNVIILRKSSLSDNTIIIIIILSIETNAQKSPHFQLLSLLQKCPPLYTLIYTVNKCNSIYSCTYRRGLGFGQPKSVVVLQSPKFRTYKIIYRNM